MKKYTNLKHKAKDNDSIQGKSKVYFCCHPSDFKRYFDDITSELFKYSNNIVFWYYDPSEGFPNDAAFFDDLAIMQLFVVPVTSNFIYLESQARNIEYKFAMEHNIPVLPLMQEPDLVEAFNKTCGNIQFIDKTKILNDPTAIPYEKRMKDFLFSVLVNDELIQKIRAAFYAYIFLSYRKKDRKYAQQIMHLIHENDFCRDIAIWYDEFLIPGEDFNSAIAKALKNCSLFALTVTPNLVNEQNYVMNIEYPEATKLQKPIIPIEGVETDKNEMSRYYNGIDATVKRDSIPEALRAKLGALAKAENDSDPEHLFFIGLAYLKGIDVEVNVEKAIGLLQESASRKLPEACKMLSCIYRDGDGVPRDHAKAIKWQKKLCTLLKLNKERIREYYEELNELGNQYMKNTEFDQGIKTYLLHNRCVIKAFKTSGQYSDAKTVINSNNKIGNYYKNNKEYEKAHEFFDASVVLCKSLIEREEQLLYDLSNTFFLVSDLEREEGLVQAAEENAVQSVVLREQYSRVVSTNNQLELAIHYDRAGWLLKRLGNNDRGLDYLLKAKNLLETLFDESKSETLLYALNANYLHLYQFYKGNLRKQKTYCRKMIAICEDHEKKYCSILNEMHLSNSYQWIADIYRDEELYHKEKEYYSKCLKKREKLAELPDVITYKRNLAGNYCRIGEIHKREGDTKKVLYYHKKCLEALEHPYAAKSRALLNRIDNLLK